jgi:arsenite/tail-anchored protein-transporting ATPase
MAPILVYTGSAGPGIAIAAAAAALRAAESGRNTLLLSLGTAQSLGALIGTQVSGAPSEVAPHLDALALDPLADLAAAWNHGRASMPAQLAQVGGDELPLLPGMEAFFGLLRLRDLAPRYDQVVVDAGPHEHLLRALALPDSLRWGVRLLFGLDRGPGRSPASVSRAILPTTFMPISTLDRVQETRVEAERLRTLLTTPGSASAHYVLRPDAPALEEARLAIPALQLHGMAASTLIAGPLLPDDVSDERIAALAEQQAELVAEARALWPARALLRFTLPAAGSGLAALHRIARQIDDQPHAIDEAPLNPPIVEQLDGAPALVFDLPGMPKNALRLTLSGDELIVQIGPYRRHILLPEGLRGISEIKATREGDRLIVRRRT